MIRHPFTVAVFIILMLLPLSENARAASRGEIEAGVNSTLRTLYRTVGGSAELAAEASGVLVFPTVYKAGFGIGGGIRRGRTQTRQADSCLLQHGFSIGRIPIGRSGEIRCHHVHD